MQWTPRTKYRTTGVGSPLASRPPAGNSPPTRNFVQHNVQVSPFRTSPRQRRFDPSFVAPVLSGIRSESRQSCRPSPSPRATVEVVSTTSNGNTSARSSVSSIPSAACITRQSSRPSPSPRIAADMGAVTASSPAISMNLPPKPPPTGGTGLAPSPVSALNLPPKAPLIGGAGLAPSPRPPTPISSASPRPMTPIASAKTIGRFQFRTPWPRVQLSSRDYNILTQWQEVVEPAMEQLFPFASIPWTWLDSTCNSWQPQDEIDAKLQPPTFADFTKGCNFRDDSKFESWCQQRKAKNKPGQSQKLIPKPKGSPKPPAYRKPLAPPKDCQPKINGKPVTRCLSADRLAAGEVVVVDGKKIFRCRSASALTPLQSPDKQAAASARRSPARRWR